MSVHQAPCQKKGTGGKEGGRRGPQVLSLKPGRTRGGIGVRQVDTLGHNRGDVIMGQPTFL